ncbi:hypothetical protein K439DRAFT_1627031 [Ramaria rubella]|nr:hypothetical protein K439DRAFT_1627031 [Ramaria rubella]
MSTASPQKLQTTSYTSLIRVSNIPIVESSITTIHSTLSTAPLLRTPYALSLSISSHLTPYIQSASTHYPFAPLLTYGDLAANKGLDLAQEKWPYPFQSKPEQVWCDVMSVADLRVVQPASRMAKSVDQSLTPLVDSFSFVVKKIDADADSKAQLDARARAADDCQIQRAYALLRVLKDDVLRTPNEDQNALVKNIHATLTAFTQQSSALLAAVRSRSEGAASRVHELAIAILSELDKLAPMVSSLTSNTSSTLKDTTNNLRDIVASKDPIGQKIPKVGAAVQDGVRGVVEDIVEKVHEIVEDIRSSSSGSSGSSSPTPSSPSKNSTPKRDSLNPNTSKLKRTPRSPVKGGSTQASTHFQNENIAAGMSPRH